MTNVEYSPATTNTKITPTDAGNNSAGFEQVRNSAILDSDPEPSATTNIINDGEVNVAKMSDQVKLNNTLLTAASVGVPQDLQSFLAKPYPIKSGQLTSSDTPGSFSVTQLFRQITNLDIYSSKLKGFLGIRATIILRLQLNADRFMQGRYILAFMPMVTDSTKLNGYNNSAARSAQMRNAPTTVTQLPHVQFDVNCDTQATLEIPYVSPYSHYSLATGHGDVGSYFIYPYSPLVTGSTGSNACQYTLWLSMKDVELVAPTLPAVPLTSQMARPKGMTAQRGSVSEQEAASVGQGPISSVLNKVSKAADIMSQIPVISLVAKQVGWASNIMASAASVFGWSKPIALAGPMRMKETTVAFWNNPDAVDYSLPLSMMSDNTVEALPGFAGSDRDEMSIDFLKAIPAYITSFEWNTTQMAGASLWSSQCSPGRFYLDGTDGTQVYRIFTPVSQLAAWFRNYKGSLRFTFKVVKTEFHSGRLTFSYAPSQANVNSFSLADSTYLLRENLDIRMGNEFSFVVPYASLQTYKRMDESYGLVQIHVLNELVAPASVSSSVRVLVEVSGAPDLEYAFPIGTQLTPYVPLVSQSNWPEDDDIQKMLDNIPNWKLERAQKSKAGQIALQNGYTPEEFIQAEYAYEMESDDEEYCRMTMPHNPRSLEPVPLESQMDRPECSIVEGTIAASSMFDDKLASARYCVGEKVMSLVSFLKRATWQVYRRDVGEHGGWSLQPFSISTAANNNLEIEYDVVRSDWYSMICSAYALSRGGMRIKALVPNDPTAIYRSDLYAVPLNYDPYQSASTGNLGQIADLGKTSYGLTLSTPLFDKTAEVQIPQYGKFHSRVNQELIMGPSQYRFNLISPTVPDLAVYFETRYACQPTFYRAVSDDFQCGYFTGFPPMIVGT